MANRTRSVLRVLTIGQSEYQDLVILEGSADVLGDKVDILKDKVGVLEDSDDVLEDDCDVLEEKVGVLEDNVDVLEDDVDVLEDNVEVLEDDVDVLEDNVEVLEDDIYVLEDNVEVLEDDVDVLEDNVEVLEDDLDVLEDNVEVLEDNVDVLEDDVDVLEDNVEVLDVDVDVLEDNFEVLEDDVDVLEDNVEVLEDNVDDVEDDVEVLEDNVDDVEDDVEVLEDNVDDVEDDVEVLEDNLDVLEDKVDVLEDNDGVLEDKIEVLEDNADVLKVGRDICLAGEQDEAFFILDLGDVVRKHEEWRRQLPRVHPYYAVKCHANTVMIRALAALGTGFDCASRGEIDQVMGVGVPASRIIYANPAKSASHIRHAATLGVHLMTFDNDIELRKMLTLDPAAKLVLRFHCDAVDAKISLGKKFGCDALLEGPRLIRQVRELDGDLVGVSFHVGCHFEDLEVYRRALVLARGLFDFAERMGFRMMLLDIGGGFSGHSGSSIAEIASVINSALSELFPDPELQVIAEPGTFFATSAFTLYTQINAKRVIHNEDGRHFMYYINDGTHSSFGRLLFNYLLPTLPSPVKPVSGAVTSSSIWGQTCNSADVVYEHILLPEMETGDWLEMRDMGAYTRGLASTFNGFPVPVVHVVVSRSVGRTLIESFSGSLEIQLDKARSILGLDLGNHSATQKNECYRKIF